MVEMRLEDVCTIFTDGDWIESKDQSEAGIRLVQTGNVGEGVFLEKEERAKYISEDTFKSLKCTEIFPGDVLISRLPDPVGRACIVPDKSERMITAVDCTICRPDETIILKEYLCYFMRSNAYYTRLLGNVAGTTRKRISRKNLGNVELIVPQKDEQKSVVEQLDLITDNIVCYKKQISDLDDLIRSRFVEMFGDLKSNTKGWNINTFEELTYLITDGEHATPRRTDKGIYLLSARNVLNHSIQLENVDYIDQEEYDRIAKRVIPQAGDVLISCSGTVGRCCKVPEGLKFQMVRSAALLRFKEIINPVFAEYMVTSDYLQEQINSSKTASSQANLFQGKIKALKGIVPPRELQDEFADFVAQVDKSKLTLCRYNINVNK